ncbi:MAG TPA: hypothetical protein VJQ49_09585 [Casimicrobiaceae bacterium]|nr:hypothetical protein [Casimicrobiaceae bacterium]
MNLDKLVRYRRLALGTMLALGTTCALAGEPAAQATVDQDDSTIVVADGGAVAMDAQASTAARGFNPIEAGVRRAAAQGPEALRRYIWRTRMIYNYYYWDFARR